ncbi:hypothetical protein CHLRE_12g492700v5 [Chlamydomonas reinhardtii]|uniref:FAS1 domain-containing protein n=1 Tax=Chlamydomonas reinhardtii TaxID=3055 RepID=A0A2K3D1W1_CHLRE|nr:uncharacterized protein CHLRE_12g492700v5 [Chlamydomonas reinhardtii]PNW74523.1 hypothetical protein CHLRE_12g492700v5 [Chlamydomonas reinhardtii]
MARWAAGVALVLAGVGLQMASHAAAQSAFTAVATAADPGLFLFTSALQLSGLVTFFNATGRNITLFAPSDQALLAALPALNLNQSQLVTNAVLMAPVLMYHAFVPATNNASVPPGISYYNALNTDGSVSGNQLAITRTVSGGLRVTSIGSDANVIKVDLPNSGSTVVHVVDAVLLPFYPSVYSAVARTSALSTLAALVGSASASLVSKLQDTTGVYTVFAPYNAAFTAALAPSGLNTTIAQLAAQPALLQSILSYHVVPGLYNASSFSTTPITVTTLTGQKLTLVKDGTSLSVKTADGMTANLLQARDLPCGFTDQGTFRATVHVIDKVLVPPPVTSVAAALALRTDVNTLLAAVKAEGSYSAAINSTTFTGTLLAPIDSAFTALLAANGSISAAQLLGNTTALKKILDAHVVTGSVLTVAGLTNGQNITTSGGATITVVKTGTTTQLKLGNSVVSVVGAEVAIGSSATLIVIDGVLVPSGVSTVTSGGGGGAAAATTPSFVLMLWSVVAAALLLAFQRLQ